MPKNATFAHDSIEALRDAKIIGVCAGTEHRYTGIWVVVVDGRPFVRSWNDKPTGWFRAFRKEPDGTIQVAGIEIPVRQIHSQRTPPRSGDRCLRAEVQHEGIAEVGGRLWRTRA